LFKLSEQVARLGDLMLEIGKLLPDKIGILRFVFVTITDNFQISVFERTLIVIAFSKPWQGFPDMILALGEPRCYYL